MYSTQTGSRMRSSIVKSSFVFKSADAGRHIGTHIRYIQEREKGELERGKEREFFDRQREGVERGEVEQEMKQNQGRKVSMHKLILSPGDNAVDLREYTRESMEALEERLGHKLNWYGVEHRNTDNHHVHVVIAGRIPGREYNREKGEAQKREEEAERAWRLKREQDQDRTKEEARLEKLLDRFDREAAARGGAAERGDVYLDRGDLAELRAAGNEYRIRERSFDRALEKAWEREFEREPERDRDREREPEPERQYKEPVYDREKAERMIDQLLEKTTDRAEEERLIESTDRSQDWLDRIVEEDKERLEDYYKPPERELPSGRNEELDRLLGWEHSRTHELDGQREREEYEQRTGFAGEPDRGGEAEEAAQTFEADRLTADQQQTQDHERDRDDMDRGDDFGR